MGIARYSPSPRGADEDRPRFALKGGQEAPVEPEPPVRVQLQALHELQRSQTALERYVRASFGSQERLNSCFKVLGWLSERKTHPMKLKNEDYWLRGIESLDTIEPLSEFLTVHNLDNEADFAKWGSAFDEALKTSRSLAGKMKRPDKAGDPGFVADELEQAVIRMNDVSIEVLSRCERNAGEVIDAVKDGLNQIFMRIEAERHAALEKMERRQQAPVDPSDFVVPTGPTDDIRQPDQVRVEPPPGRDEAETPTRERQIKGRRKQVSAFR